MDHLRDINHKLTANEREREEGGGGAREPFQRCPFERRQKKAQTVVLLLMSLLILFSFGRSWISSHSNKIDNELRHPL